jgi:hypothetical protein
MIATKGEGRGYAFLLPDSPQRRDTRGRSGELLRSAEIAIQYGARVARDIASDPNCDREAGTVVIVIDAFGAEIARHRVEGRRSDGGEPSSGREEGPAA